MWVKHLGISFIVHKFFTLVVLSVLLQCAYSKITDTNVEKIAQDVHFENNMTRSGINFGYTRSDSYRNIVITSLRTVVVNPDMKNHFGIINYRIVTQSGIGGIRVEYQEMKFNSPSFDGTCYPSFFMVLKDDIASSTYCGDFSSNQHDIIATEGTVVDILIINQLPYMHNESPKWRILISQIPNNNIEAQPLMEAEKQYCGIKKDSPPDERTRTTLNDLPLMPIQNAPWVEDDFYSSQCRLGRSGCRAMRNSMEEYKSKNYSNKIINGREAKTWPWMVALGTLKNGKFKIFCGGSIVGRQYIATAAHCVQFSRHGMSLKDIAVAIRVHDLSKKEFQREYITISKVMSYPGFHGIRNDFALLQLDHPLIYDDKCSSLCLPWNTDDQLEGSRVVITGWGLTSSYGSPSPTLQEASVRCIPNANCSANWIAVSGKEMHGLIESSMVCCGETNVATCNGDSGSPVTYEGANRRWTMAGLVSFGPDYNCVDPRYVLSVNSRTTYFMKWIALSLAKPTSADIVTYN